MRSLGKYPSRNEVKSEPDNVVGHGIGRRHGELGLRQPKQMIMNQDMGHAQGVHDGRRHTKISWKIPQVGSVASLPQHNAHVYPLVEAKQVKRGKGKGKELGQEKRRVKVHASAS